MANWIFSGHVSICTGDAAYRVEFSGISVMGGRDIRATGGHDVAQRVIPVLSAKQGELKARQSMKSAGGPKRLPHLPFSAPTLTLNRTWLLRRMATKPFQGAGMSGKSNLLNWPGESGMAKIMECSFHCSLRTETSKSRCLEIEHAGREVLIEKGQDHDRAILRSPHVKAINASCAAVTCPGYPAP